MCGSGGKWHVATVPQPGRQRDMLFAAAAVSARDVWVAGDAEGSNGVFRTLVEHFNGSRWSVMPTPNPGAGRAITCTRSTRSAADNVWAVGQGNVGAGAPDQPLAEHWNGRTGWLPGFRAASSAERTARRRSRDFPTARSGWPGRRTARPAAASR